MNYIRKYICFNEDNLDVLDFLNAKGRKSSEYICDLIRMDMNKEIHDMQELNKRLEELENMVIFNYYKKPTETEIKESTQKVDLSRIDF